MFKPYKALGGNGTGEELYNRCLAMEYGPAEREGLDMMDFGIASVAAITVVCYLGGMACKGLPLKIKDEVIPVVCG